MSRRRNLAYCRRLVFIEEFGDAGHAPVWAKLLREIAQAGVSPRRVRARSKCRHLQRDARCMLNLTELDVVFGEPAQVKRVLPDLTFIRLVRT